jgi:hypothetical protein
MGESKYLGWLIEITLMPIFVDAPNIAHRLHAQQGRKLAGVFEFDRTGGSRKSRSRSRVAYRQQWIDGRDRCGATGLAKIDVGPLQSPSC